MLDMEKALENSAAFEVLRRWMPELKKAALESGQREDALLEKALRHALPRMEEVDLPRMIAEAKASGSTPIDDLDVWLKDRKEALRERLWKLL